VKPRRRDDEASVSSDRLGRKEVVDIKKKAKRDLTKPRRRGRRGDESEITELSHISKKEIVDTKKGKEKRSKSITKKTIGKGRKKGEGSETSSDKVSNISTKVIVETRKGKGAVYDTKDYKIKGKYDKIEEGQKYFSKIITIVPADKGYDIAEGLRKSDKYFSKNIVIEPMTKDAKKQDYTKRTQSTAGRDLGIESRKGREYGSYESRFDRTASVDNKTTGKVIDILKGVKYYTKNIVIQPVQKDARIGKKNTYSTIGTDKDRKDSKESSGIDNQIFSSGRQSKLSLQDKRRDKKPWDIEFDIFSGRSPSDQDILSDSVLRSMEGIDENTKFYHKEITILPVVLPPLRFSKP